MHTFIGDETSVMIEDLKQTFVNLARRYSADEQIIHDSWSEIADHYSKKDRYYHNLEHLSNMLGELRDVENRITAFEAVLYALYYHDIIYDPSKGDNEEKSAELASQRLLQLNVPSEAIAKCLKLILATKTHSVSDDPDINFFCDADLSILGAEPNRYSKYTQDIKNEYSIYPSVIFKSGRKNVLNHFLKMERIFKSDHFHDKYESCARRNLAAELETL